jgi:gas vesicle protein
MHSKKINKEVCIMNFRELQDLLNRETRKTEKTKAAQKFAIGIVVAAAAGAAAGILFALKPGKETREDLSEKALNTAETIRETVQKKAATMHDSAAHAAQEVRDVIEKAHGKPEDVMKNLKDGYHEIKQDIQYTAEKISDDIH